MNKKSLQRVFLPVLFFALLLLSATAVAAVQGGRLTIDHPEKTDITGDWFFQYGFDQSQVGSPATDTVWQNMDIPLFWPTNDEDERRTGCYRLTFDLSTDIADEQWAIQLGRVRYLYRLYLNGELIGGNGVDLTDKGEEAAVNHHRELCFLLPGYLVVADGENQLYLWVDDIGQEQGGTQGRGFYLASLNEMKRIQALNSAPVAGLALLILCLVAYLGYLYYFGGRAKYVGQFALLLLMFGLPMIGGIAKFIESIISPTGYCIAGLAAAEGEGGPGLAGAALYLILVPLLLVRFCKTFFELAAGKVYRIIHLVSAVELASLVIFGGFGMVRQLNQIQFVIVLLLIVPYLIHGIGGKMKRGDRYASRLVLSLAATAALMTAGSLLYSLQLVNLELDRMIIPVLALLLFVLAVGVRKKAKQEMPEPDMGEKADNNP
jgi:hypothetical protein